jgi:hypothetical protein
VTRCDAAALEIELQHPQRPAVVSKLYRRVTSPCAVLGGFSLVEDMVSKRCRHVTSPYDVLGGVSIVEEYGFPPSGCIIRKKHEK